MALLNIQIPISLGELTNVLSKFLPKSSGETQENFSWPHFLANVQEPAVKLVTMYIFQSLFTFINIGSLTIVGEKMASRLKLQLFDAIITQDIEFFDSNQTGEVINRLTGDVQDFKSAFKQVLSQGLRSVTQVSASDWGG